MKKIIIAAMLLLFVFIGMISAQEQDIIKMPYNEIDLSLGYAGKNAQLSLSLDMIPPYFVDVRGLDFGVVGKMNFLLKENTDYTMGLGFSVNKRAENFSLFANAGGYFGGMYDLNSAKTDVTAGLFMRVGLKYFITEKLFINAGTDTFLNLYRRNAKDNFHFSLVPYIGMSVKLKSIFRPVIIRAPRPEKEDDRPLYEIARLYLESLEPKTYTDPVTGPDSSTRYY